MYLPTDSSGSLTHWQLFIFFFGFGTFLFCILYLLWRADLFVGVSALMSLTSRKRLSYCDWSIYSIISATLVNSLEIVSLLCVSSTPVSLSVRHIDLDFCVDKAVRAWKFLMYWILLCRDSGSVSRTVSGASHVLVLTWTSQEWTVWWTRLSIVFHILDL